MLIHTELFSNVSALGLIHCGLHLEKNFGPRPHSFWHQPWPHAQLASLTSLLKPQTYNISVLVHGHQGRNTCKLHQCCLLVSPRVCLCPMGQTDRHPTDALLPSTTDIVNVTNKLITETASAYLILTHWNWLSGYSSWNGWSDSIVPSHQALSIRQRNRSPTETSFYCRPVSSQRPYHCWPLATQSREYQPLASLEMPKHYPQPINGSVGPKSPHPNGTLNGLSTFAGLTVTTNGQTYTDRLCNMCRNRPHPTICLVMQLNKNLISLQ